MKWKTFSGIVLTLLLISTLTLAFNIQPVKSDWTWTGSYPIYIRADGSVDPDTAPISTVDNITYTLTDNIRAAGDFPDGIEIEKDNTIVDGAGYTLYAWWQTGTGIHMRGRSNVTIKNMGIENFYRGIRLTESSNNTLAGNNITNSGGIRLSSSSNNSIFENDITNGGGIGLSDSSNNNTVSGNNIANNNMGISLEYSSNNTIYHNNFVNNTEQAHLYLHASFYNVWDDGYPSGGNYWSDYTGMDRNGDCIGDTPYVIDENNQDNYPLIRSPFEHELATSIKAPTYSITQLGVPISLNATVTNQGSSDESNVELVLLINGAIADSKTISFLESCDSYTLSYLWTPTVRGICNVTAYVYPISREAHRKQ